MAASDEHRIYPEGLSALPGILARAGSRRVLVLTGESGRYLDRVRALLAGLEIEVFPGARRHVPEGVLSEARQRLGAFAADTIVALGGGSAIGLGKALRLDRELTFVAVPTTYAGSERTNIYGTTAGGKKTTGRDPRVRPDAVIYDVELTLGMPKGLTVTSLMNAFAHPLAGLATSSLDGDARERALRALEIIAGVLEALVRAPDSRQARADALEGAGLAAQSLETGTPGLHHKLAHTLGGRFDLDHGGLHSVLLPHTVHRLRAEAPAVAAEIDDRLQVPDLEASLFDLLVRAGAATSLKSLGVPFEGFRKLLAETPDLPRELLSAAFHGRCPSRETRLEDWGLAEPVSVRGPALEQARRVVVAVHGRGATADGILARAVELSGNDPAVAIVAPQATNNVWYAKPYSAPRAEIGAELDAARAAVGAVVARAVERAGASRVALFGFSQGACLALEVFAARSERLGALVALSGAAIGITGEQRAPGAGAAGTPVLLGASARNPYLGGGDVEWTARMFADAGCDVRLEMVPGDGHGLHGRQRAAARALLRGLPAAPPLPGYGNVHESESLPGALPRDRNSPRPAPYGLYAEQVSGTGFVAPRAANRRAWLYRIRPSAQQGPSAPLAHPTLRADFVAEPPEANLIGFAPLPLPEAPADFVDGLATLGGAGSPRLRRGFAVHVYAANRSMEERCFSNADGNLLLLPELGALTLFTELGVLEVAPGQLAVLPRGLRFSVHLPGGGAARGYVAEVFGRHFELPERGPVGANGLAEARHFQAPAAWHEERLSPGFRLTSKLGGELHDATQDYSPFDVVAWHGSHCPYVYDLARFSPVGNTRFDHGDPSIYTVLSAPLDEPGSNGLDLVVFPPRWDPTEGTFRPPYFHRNVTTEINGIIRDEVAPGSPFVPGICFLTPSLTPHGVRAGAVERALRAGDDRPQRVPDGSLWFQFETALPFSLTPWAREAPHRIADWHHVWGTVRKHFRVE